MSISASHLMDMLGAVVLAAVGGEFFLKGVLGVAASLRLPKLLVATSLAAFATSSPELTVSVVAALAGKPEIGLGDALGSNVVNIALVFGVALLFGPIRLERRDLGRDFVLALAVPVLTLWFVFDGIVTRWEGCFLLLIFAVWIGLLTRAGLAARGPEGVGEEALWRSLLFAVAGLLALVLAGRLFVGGATAVAAAFSIDAYIVGAILVAIGTSLPELVTVLLARMRGHDDIGIGTLLGSNLFNGLAIVGIAASIHPIVARPAEVAVALGVGALSLLLLIPGRSLTISRGRGLVLLAAYAIFVAVTIGAGQQG